MAMMPGWGYLPIFAELSPHVWWFTTTAERYRIEGFLELPYNELFIKTLGGQMGRKN